jgi:uncharacterized protein YndB with AHSA1/START domain
MNMITTKTVDVTTPSDREIRVARTFNASARQVFDFHTRPEKVRKWLLGPAGWDMPVCDIDLTVGGQYHYVWQNAADAAQFGVRGQFREIDAPHRLVHTEGMEGVPGAEGGEALITVTFDERDSRTTLTTLMLFDTQEGRDMALQSGMTDGMAISYDRMEQVISEQGA